ncbi:MAG: hypothetical protein ACI8QC_000253 [Planctomycetota bacterium]|jgi:hypothetical protein
MRRLVSLCSFTGPVAPGRYWVNGEWLVGLGGSLQPLGDLYQFMAQQAQAGGSGPGGGGDNAWSSRLGSGNLAAGGSSSYIHIPDSGGGSGVLVSY